MFAGFTFKGKHSSAYGIVYRVESRTLLPPVRRNSITIPGRSGFYAQDDGAYDERQESIVCGFKKGTKIIHAQAREIAGWLSGEGLLSYDDDPGIFYQAKIYDAPSLTTYKALGEFAVTFTMNPPFAFSEEKTLPLSTHAAAIQYKGTADAPCKIVIRNDTAYSISNIQVMFRRKGDQ